MAWPYWVEPQLRGGEGNDGQQACRMQRDCGGWSKGGLCHADTAHAAPVAPPQQRLLLTHQTTRPVSDLITQAASPPAATAKTGQVPSVTDVGAVAARGAPMADAGQHSTRSAGEEARLA